MANPRKNSIHHQMMSKRSSRSEYNDGLLRHNQRHENRLALELEQWEKAQRTVAKGLEKESARFKQNSSAALQRSASRKISSTDLVEGRLIPDYQYRNRSGVVNHSGTAEGDYTDAPGRDDDVRARESDVKSADQTDSSKSRSSKKQSKSSESRKSISSKHGEQKKSHKSCKSGGGEELRDRESEKRERDKKGGSGGGGGRESMPSTEKKVSKSPTEHASTPTKANELSVGSEVLATSASVKTSASSKYGQKKQPANNDNTTSTTTMSPTTTATNSNNDAAMTSQEVDAKADLGAAAEPTSKSTKSSSSLLRRVHDPGDIIVSPGMVREMDWDYQRRYTNVWDNLSAPKRHSQVRSVRNRLQREFTQVPATTNNDLFSAASSSRVFASSARKTGRAPVL